MLTDHPQKPSSYNRPELWEAVEICHRRLEPEVVPWDLAIAHLIGVTVPDRCYRVLRLRGGRMAVRRFEVVRALLHPECSPICHSA